jgi:hypothetical protein
LVRTTPTSLFAGTGLTYNLNQKGLGSVTGRIGYTWGPALLYVKGGYAYSDYSESLVTTVAGAPVAFAAGTKHDGYTVGAGLEYLFTQNWSGKVEYQYYDFGKTQFSAPSLWLLRRLVFQERRAHRQGRPELPLQLGWPGCCEVLSFAPDFRLLTTERPAETPAFFVLPFGNLASPATAKGCRFTRILTRYLHTLYAIRHQDGGRGGNQWH